MKPRPSDKTKKSRRRVPVLTIPLGAISIAVDLQHMESTGVGSPSELESCSIDNELTIVLCYYSPPITLVAHGNWYTYWS